MPAACPPIAPCPFSEVNSPFPVNSRGPQYPFKVLLFHLSSLESISVAFTPGALSDAGFAFRIQKEVKCHRDSSQPMFSPSGSLQDWAAQQFSQKPIMQLGLMVLTASIWAGLFTVPVTLVSCSMSPITLCSSTCTLNAHFSGERI